MTPERRKEIASMGGKKAHELGVAHQFTPEEASLAAKKVKDQSRRHRWTPEEARALGEKYRPRWENG